MNTKERWPGQSLSAGLVWKMTAVLMVARGFAMLFTGTFGPLTPFLAEEFGLTEPQVGLCSSFMYIGALAFIFPAARHIDMVGPRGPLATSVVLVPLMLLGLSFTSTFYGIAVVYFISGVPRALILPATGRLRCQGYPLPGRYSSP